MPSVTNLANTIWEFNDEVNIPEVTRGVTFSTFFNTYTAMIFTEMSGAHIEYQTEGGTSITVYDEENGWYKNDYKTVVFLTGMSIGHQAFIEWLEENATLKWSASTTPLSELSITSIPNLEIWERLYNAKTIVENSKDVIIIPPEQTRIQLHDILWKETRFDTGTLQYDSTDFDIADATESTSTTFWFGPRVTSDNLYGSSGLIDRDYRYTATFSWSSTAQDFDFLKGMYIQKKIRPTDSSTTTTYIPSDATITIITNGSTKTLNSDKWQRYNNVLPATDLTIRAFPQNIKPADGVNNETDEWKKLGTILENLVERPIVKVGYYIGNGLMGEEDACELSFSFRPKMLMIYGTHVRQLTDAHCYGPLILAENEKTVYNNDMFSSDVSTPLQVRWFCVPWAGTDLSTIKWWSTVSGSQQMNTNNKIYSYLAIG